MTNSSGALWATSINEHGDVHHHRIPVTVREHGAAAVAHLFTPAGVL